MNLRNSLFAAAAVFASCGNDVVIAEENDLSTQDYKEIIGGFNANAKVLDAIGTVGTLDGDTYSFFCSATLISPDTVLTAKHCAMVTDDTDPLFGLKYVNLMPIYFAVGPDANHPAKVIEAIAADLSPVSAGGSAAIGNDVAIYHLVEPITDVTPMKVADAPLSSKDVNKAFAMVGYGSKDNYEDLSGYLSATRATGRATLRALAGKNYELMFGSWEAFFKAMSEYYGSATANEYIDVIQGWYDETVVLNDYEVYTGHVAGDAQACHGDSGGPLVGRENGEKKIFGVASTVFFSTQMTCDYGTMYGSIGPKTKKMIDEGVRYVDPCAGGITVAGRCDGDVAVRCTDKWEGDRSRSEIDCSLLDQVCVIGANGRAGCSDEEEKPAAHPAAPTATQIRTSIVNTAHKMTKLGK